MHDKIVFLAKSKLKRIEVVISKALIDSVNSHEEFVLINKFNICFNVIKGYNEIKEELKDSNNK